MKNKFLSIFLALALCLTLLPTAAFAEEGAGSEPTTPTHSCAKEGHAVDKADTTKCAYCGTAIAGSGTWENVSDGFPDRLYGTGTWNLSADGTLTVLGDADTVAKVTDDITAGINKAGHAVTTVTGTAANATVTTEGNSGSPKTTVVYKYGAEIEITLTFTASKTDGGWNVATTPSVTATKDGYEVLKSIDDKIFTVQKTTSGSGGSTSTSVVATVTAESDGSVTIKITKDSVTTQFTVKTTAYSAGSEDEYVAVTTSLSTGEGEDEELIAQTKTEVYASGDQVGTIFYTKTSTGDDEDETALKKEIYGTGELPDCWNAEQLPWYKDRDSVKKIVIGEGITAIGGSSFCGCENLTKVVLPEGLKKIGDSAFSSCASLKSITIPEGVMEIGSTVFSGCTSLTEIEVAAGNQNYKSVDGVLFTKDGKTLIAYPAGKTDTSYTIPEDVTTISGEAFKLAEQLTTLSLPASLTSISGDDLYSCSNLTTIHVAEGNATYKSIDGVLFSADGKTLLYYPPAKAGSSYTIPSSVTEIGAMAFFYATALTSVTIPASVTSIETEAFVACTSLTAIHVAEGNADYKSIDGVLFSADGKTLLCCPIAKTGSYTVPEGVETIDAYAFTQSELTSVSLPEGVTEINAYAFLGAEKLVSVSLPSTVNSMGAEAFSACYSLKHVYFAGSADQWNGMDIPNRNDYGFEDANNTNTCLGIDETVTTIRYEFDGKLTVTLDPNGGTLKEGIQTSWTVPYNTASSYTPPSPTRAGYSFAGWTYSVDIYNRYTQTVSTTSRVWNWNDPVYQDMELTARWSRNSYAITVKEPVTGGTVTVAGEASWGSAVPITVVPDAGYVLVSLTVKNKAGKEFELTNKGEGEYTFTMPKDAVSVTAVFAPEKTAGDYFSDVKEEAYYADAVLWAAKNGVTSGVSNDLFGPDQSCTRAQVVTFLYRAAGSPEPEAASGFADVSVDSYYAKAVAWAVENGITTGTNETAFSPDETCTRAQAAAFLFRYATLRGMETVTLQELVSGFTDADSVPGYSLPAFNWALANGIVQGYNGNLMPNNDCTRAQIVTMLYRLLGSN